MEFGHAVETLRVRAVVFNLLHRKGRVRHVRNRLLLAQDHQPIPVRVGKRAEQHAVHHAEDRRIRADPERHRRDHHQRKPWVPPQVPPPVADVLAQRFEQPRQPGLTHVVLDPIDATNRAERGPPRLADRHPATDVTLRQHVDMELEFAIEILFQTLTAEQ